MRIRFVVSIVFTCLVSAIYSPALFADEFYSIITDIDPIYARQIVDLLLKTDIAESMLMARSIGETDKPINNIITILCETNSTQEKNKVELILRILLESVFNTTLDTDALDRRISINREGLDFLMRQIDSFDDRLLKGKIISLIPLLHVVAYEKIVQKEGFIIVKLLRKNNGYCSRECEEEIYDILYAVKLIGSKQFLVLSVESKDYFDLCVEIMDSTKNSKIYEQAKEIAKSFTQ